MAACSSDVCGQSNSAVQAVNNQYGNCQAASGTPYPVLCFDTQVCETDIKSCTEADEAVFRAVATCQNDFASNNDCSQAAINTEDACALSASFNADGGSALSPACAQQFANNPPQSQGMCSAGGS
jgi:hypothetical protein